MKTARFLRVFFILSSLFCSESLGHEWTDKSGKYRVEAEFVALEEKTVRLRRKDGKVISVALAKLSPDDRRLAVRLSRENKPSKQPTNAEEIVKKYPSGKIYRRFTVIDGKKHGDFVEFYENGQVKIRASYAKDKLNNKYESHHANGKPHVIADYREGKLDKKYLEKDEDGRNVVTAEYDHGQLDGVRVIYDDGKPVSRQLWRRGELVGLNDVVTHPFTREDLKSHITRIQRARHGGNFSEEHVTALQRLNVHRLLAGVPPDVMLDSQQCFYAQAGSHLVAKIGKFDHEPANPGLPNDVYRNGLTGTKNSNITKGETMAKAVDNLMLDWHVKDVGHRRWCLNPAMGTTGFGRTNVWFCMWSLDQRRRGGFRWNWLAYPGRGLMPSECFHSEATWSVSLNPRKFGPPPNDFNVQVWSLDENLTRGQSLPIKTRYLVGKPKVALPYTLVFLPGGISAAPNHRYWITIGGLRTPTGQPATIEYLVEFIDLGRILQ